MATKLSEQRQTQIDLRSGTMTTARYPYATVTQNQRDDTYSFGFMLREGCGARVTIPGSLVFGVPSNRQLLQAMYEDIARQLARYALEEDEQQGRQI